jgi:hypothetical protein
MFGKSKAVWIHTDCYEAMKQFSDEIRELRDILKEAGILVTPPKNISVPDPRGYSVNKIK